MNYLQHLQTFYQFDVTNTIKLQQTKFDNIEIEWELKRLTRGVYCCSITSIVGCQNKLKICLILVIREISTAIIRDILSLLSILHFPKFCTLNELSIKDLHVWLNTQFKTTEKLFNTWLWFPCFIVANIILDNNQFHHVTCFMAINKCTMNSKMNIIIHIQILKD